ncbi:MAG: N-acetylneuraminate synthase family protein [Chitinophagaceae bacterium]
MNPYLEIQGRKIGYDYDPLIIAEIGINHEGSLKTAFEMVDAAFDCGVELIKHQTHIVEDEMSGAAKKVIPGNADVSIYEIMQRCALNEEDEIALKNYVESKGMIFISTPFSRAAVNRLKKMKVPAYKIGSGECNNYPLLEYVASLGKPVILSTGMNTIENIAQAVQIFKKYKTPYALLHCTNIYPTPPHLVRLGAIPQLMKEFPDAVVGLSDHTTDNLACLGSVALGASILERHFTDNMNRPGPDIVCSMDPSAFKELSYGAGILKKERGGEKGYIKEEQATIDFAYASVVTIQPIKIGETFTHDNLWVKRPGTGELLAKDYNNILGKTASRDLPSDYMIKKGDIN